jgi:hypothetical protein
MRFLSALWRLALMEIVGGAVLLSDMVIFHEFFHPYRTVAAWAVYAGSATIAGAVTVGVFLLAERLARPFRSSRPGWANSVYVAILIPVIGTALAVSLGMRFGPVGFWFQVITGLGLKLYFLTHYVEEGEA